LVFDASRLVWWGLIAENNYNWFGAVLSGFGTISTLNPIYEYSPFQIVLFKFSPMGLMGGLSRGEKWWYAAVEWAVSRRSHIFMGLQ
jgi:hypothetical protein